MPLEREGHVDGWKKLDDGNLVIWGWALWQPATGPKMRIYTNLPVAKMAIKTLARPDVAAELKEPRLANSGFEMTVYLDKSNPAPEVADVCLWTEDTAFGRRRLHKWDLCQGN